MLMKLQKLVSVMIHGKLSVFTVKKKQEGLYYVEYHPAGGDANVEHLLAALDYAVTLDQVEARITEPNILR